MNALALNISNTPIRQDLEGRYCLNDLHKASGGELKHRPGLWMENQQTKDLVMELEKDEAGIPASKISAISILRGRGIQGTYAVKELVYAYAMWISPAFTLKVIHAYDSLVSVQYGLKQLPEPLTITKAQQGIIFNKVVSIAAGRGQIRSQIWSRFQNHFKLSSYKDLPADKFDEALDYLDAKNNEYNNGLEMLYVSNIELAALVDERVKAIEGELLPKNEPIQNNGINLKFEGDEPQKLLVSVGPLGTTITRLLPDEMVIKKGQFYIMEKKDKVSAGKLVLDYIPHEFLPHMIEVAAARLDRTEAGKLKA